MVKLPPWMDGHGQTDSQSDIKSLSPCLYLIDFSIGKTGNLIHDELVSFTRRRSLLRHHAIENASLCSYLRIGPSGKF